MSPPLSLCLRARLVTPTVLACGRPLIGAAARLGPSACFDPTRATGRQCPPYASRCNAAPGPAIIKGVGDPPWPSIGLAHLNGRHGPGGVKRSHGVQTAEENRTTLPLDTCEHLQCSCQVCGCIKTGVRFPSAVLTLTRPEVCPDKGCTDTSSPSSASQSYHGVVCVA